MFPIQNIFLHVGQNKLIKTIPLFLNVGFLNPNISSKIDLNFQYYFFVIYFLGKMKSLPLMSERWVSPYGDAIVKCSSTTKGKPYKM